MVSKSKGSAPSEDVAGALPKRVTYSYQAGAFFTFLKNSML